MRLSILAFALGVLFVQLQPALPVWPFWLAGGAVLAGAGLAGRTGVWRLLGLLGCLVLGVAYAAWRADVRLADALGAEQEGRDVVLTGVVAALPQDFTGGTRFVFDVEDGGGAVVPGQVMLSWYRGRAGDEAPAWQTVRPGERWRFVVRLKRPHGNANPGGFDYEAWLLERGIRATGYVRPPPPERLETMVWRPSYAVERLRHMVRGAFAERLPEAAYPYAGVLVALAVGDQRAIQVVL